MAEQLFKADDVAADCALGNIERLRPRGKAELLADRIERAQRIEGQPAAIDWAVDRNGKLLIWQRGGPVVGSPALVRFLDAIMPNCDLVADDACAS